MQKRDIEITNKPGSTPEPRQAHPDGHPLLREVNLERNGRRVNAKKHHGRHDARCRQGRHIQIETEGDDEADAMRDLVALIEDKFGEGE